MALDAAIFAGSAVQGNETHVETVPRHLIEIDVSRIENRSFPRQEQTSP